VRYRTLRKVKAARMPKGMSTYVLKTVGRLTSGVARTIAAKNNPTVLLVSRLMSR